MMKIILTSVETGLGDAWTNFCGELDFVTVHQGSILDLACDAVVSPANSFGFMDGGIDALYCDRFGWTVQKRLQRLIVDRHRGELLVGTAEIVETDYLRLPYLIAAPTMRVPMILGRETVTPYLATRATLLLVENGIFPEGQYAGQRISAHVESVAFPGMGTGVGKVPFDVCARQVRAAIDDVLLKKFHPPASWAEASERHQLLYSNRTRDLQY
jgi:O-acetyl-ADP-ribose deacetylase (regulator of RNase III)